MKEKEKEALAAIQELHAKDIKASKARDFETLLSLWTEDGVLLEPGKKPTVGIDAIKAYMEGQKEVSKAYEIKKYEHRWEEIKVIGSGKTIEQRGKLLRVLKKQKDGSWKAARVIAHNDP
jgi:uncharacterized protein (TIGR02246 family)